MTICFTRLVCFQPDAPSETGLGTCMFLTKFVVYQIGIKQGSTGLKVPTAPPGLFFRHVGHRYVPHFDLYFVLFFSMLGNCNDHSKLNFYAYSF